MLSLVSGSKKELQEDERKMQKNMSDIRNLDRTRLTMSQKS